MMMRVLAPLVVLLMSIASPQLAAAGQGGECCLCVTCPPVSEACVAPTIDCEAFCFNVLGCAGFTLGQGGECTIERCPGAATTTQAPTTSHLGLAVATLALTLVGLTRIARRRKTAS